MRFEFGRTIRHNFRFGGQTLRIFPKKTNSGCTIHDSNHSTTTDGTIDSPKRQCINQGTNAVEIWKPYENAMVSSLGRFKDTTGVVKTPRPNKQGYCPVRINGKFHYIHVLIAKAFDLPRRDGQNEVDHIDGNPSNNRLDNLRWATPRENVGYSYATNENRRSSAEQQSKPVEARRLGADEWVAYASSNAAARALEVHPADISACCRGVRKQAGGYEFRRGEPNEPAVLPGLAMPPAVAPCRWTPSRRDPASSPALDPCSALWSLISSP